MKYNINLNLLKMQEHGLNVNQWCILDIISTASTWCEIFTYKENHYYWISKNKICEELKALDLKADTIYRHLKLLSELGFIDYVKDGKKDLVTLTELGKTLFFKNDNSEINPTKLGNKSELSSEINPTDNGTSSNNGTNDDGEKNGSKISIEDAINHLKISAILPTFGEVNKSELTAELYKFNQYYIDKGMPEKANAKNLISWFQLIKTEDRNKFTALDKKQAPANAPKIDVSKRFAHLKG